MEDVQIALLIINDESPTSPPSFSSKLQKLFTHAGAWTIYRRYFVNRKSWALDAVNFSERFSEVSTIRCCPIHRGKFSEYFSEEDLDQIRAYDLDFIMRFGFGIIRGGILEVARYGVWSYHHDDLDKYRGRPPCFWEIYEGDPVTGAVLQRLTDRLDGGVVLKRGYFKTVDASYARNRDKVYFGSVEWPAQVCRDILNGCADYVDAPASPTEAPIYYQPKRSELVHLILKTAWNYVKKQALAFGWTDRWNVGVVDEPVHTFLNGSTLPSVSWATASRSNTYIADPFSLGSNTVLVEEYDYRTDKGRIAAFDKRKAALERLGVVMDGDTHLSYPYVFEEGGHYYCVPESAEAGEVVLYKAEESPFQWQAISTLVEEPLLDPTLLKYNGYWWLFGTMQGYYDNEKLFLWYSKELTYGWKKHPGCPVKCDVRSSRPGGRPFVYQNTLYRPAQDCSQTYGGGVAINRILHLTPTNFEEETVTRIQPDPESAYPNGLHTLVEWGERTLVDAKQQAFIPAASVRYLKRKVGRFVSKYRNGAR